jgi:hypothetical protein
VYTGVARGDFPVSLQFSASRIERYDVFAFSLALVVIDTAYPTAMKFGQLVNELAAADCSRRRSRACGSLLRGLGIPVFFQLLAARQSGTEVSG